jgi:hypothetical protein
MNSIAEIHMTRIMELLRNSVMAAIACSNQSVVTVLLPASVSLTDESLLIRVLDQLSTPTLRYNVMCVHENRCQIELEVNDYKVIHDRVFFLSKGKYVIYDEKKRLYVQTMHLPEGYKNQSDVTVFEL